jgi:hypothetical protein
LVVVSSPLSMCTVPSSVHTPNRDWARRGEGATKVTVGLMLLSRRGWRETCTTFSLSDQGCGEDSYAWIGEPSGIISMKMKRWGISGWPVSGHPLAREYGLGNNRSCTGKYVVTTMDSNRCLVPRTFLVARIPKLLQSTPDLFCRSKLPSFIQDILREELISAWVATKHDCLSTHHWLKLRQSYANISRIHA